MTNKSYCLQAGTYGPSEGDGYMFAPVLGPKEEVVVASGWRFTVTPEEH